MTDGNGARSTPGARDSGVFAAPRPRGERRACPRSRPAEEYPATFVHGGREYAATLQNVSAKGAAFRLTREADELTLEAGCVLEFAIQLPGEVATRKGR